MLKKQQKVLDEIIISLQLEMEQKKDTEKWITDSSVRRILKRGGQKFQKIWEEQRSESEVVPLKFSLIFLPNLGEEHKKKKVFTQISSHFSAKFR